MSDETEALTPSAVCYITPGGVRHDADSACRTSGGLAVCKEHHALMACPDSCKQADAAPDGERRG